jgi:G3E family GTPase
MNQPLLQHPHPKTAVFLLSGFLGSGKTTLLKRILSWETDLSDTVILVNEFGDVGIDGDMLKNAGSDVVELNSGCICCTLSNDFKQSLTNILEQYHPGRIFIESSGVADPTAIVPVLQESPLAEALKLEKIVTVLDADYWEARENFGKLFYNQLEIAHLILLNKVDLLDTAKIPVYLKELHELMPHCQVVPTIRCGIDPEIFRTRPISSGIVLKPMNFFHEVAMNESGQYDVSHTHPSHGTSVSSHHFVTFSFEHTGIMDEICFNQFVDSLPLDVFRMKGSVQFSNRTELINFVGGKGEWSKWDGEPNTRMAFIGWNVDPQEILDKLNRCIIQ